MTEEHDELDKIEAEEKKKVKQKRPKYYISNSDMMRELEIFYESGDFTEQLAKYFQKIVEGISHAPNFVNYSYNDEMKGDALLRMVMAVNDKTFDLSRPDKAFAYFTMIAWRAFQNRIKVEKKIYDGVEDYKNKVFEDYRADYNIDITTNNDNIVVDGYE
jgi:hypothetical protein